MLSPKEGTFGKETQGRFCSGGEGSALPGLPKDRCDVPPPPTPFFEIPKGRPRGRKGAESCMAPSQCGWRLITANPRHSGWEDDGPCSPSPWGNARTFSVKVSPGGFSRAERYIDE